LTLDKKPLEVNMDLDWGFMGNIPPVWTLTGIIIKMNCASSSSLVERKRGKLTEK